ncbi:MAG: methyltransferase domain-containing protein [Betaproteobacteria bacterium]|nr:methyltransferase domain-containing protein [Betaproteobacteria bacterium]
MQRRKFLTALGALGVSGFARATDQVLPLLAQAAPRTRTPDVIFVPTPDDVVNKMLEMAAVTAKDVVYDLGCGDGRIVITAAQRYGARGVGIDIDQERIREATENVGRAKVADKVKFIQGDLFEADISEATVVTLYLLTELNLRLRPKLMKDLRPGTRVVSHAFAMGDWKPERTEFVNGSSVYLWRIPQRKG